MLECSLGSHFCAFYTTNSINCKYFRICWGRFLLRGICSVLGLARHPPILSSCPWQIIEIWVIFYFHVMTHNRPIPHGITEKHDSVGHYHSNSMNQENCYQFFKKEGFPSWMVWEYFAADGSVVINITTFQKTTLQEQAYFPELDMDWKSSLSAV